jgi:hypothetical protein
MIQLTSFLLGVGAALALPQLGRVIRPILVEAAVAGMALFEGARRTAAEQLETLEDIAAEARARREEALAAGNGHHAVPAEEATGETSERPRVRRRAEGAGRRRSSGAAEHRDN